MRIEIAAQTDVGRRKRHNEDYFGIFRADEYPDCRLITEGALLCVADGLGGHLAGDIASKLAVAIVKDILKQPPPDIHKDPQEIDAAILEMMRKSIQQANQSIFQSNCDNGLIDTGKPMGTTLLAVLVTPRRVYVGNVGDSRCYHIRNGEIIGKTEDHSWVDEQVKLGLMSRSEAEVDSRKNIVTRSIGTAPEVEIDTYVWHPVAGDTLLLCTDGLSNMVKDTEILAEFSNGTTPAEVAQRLIKKANDNGGKDNITVIIADIDPQFRSVLWRKCRAIWHRHKKKFLTGVFLLMYGLVCFITGYVLGRTL